MRRGVLTALCLFSLSSTGCAGVRDVLPEMPALPGHSDLFQLSNDAQLAYEAGEDARAEKLYQGLARAVPNDPEIWLRLGNLYARANKADAAADAYLRALALDSNDARAWYNLGIVRLRQGWAATIQAHHLTKEKDPTHMEADRIVGYLGKMPELTLQAAPGAEAVQARAAPAAAAIAPENAAAPAPAPTAPASSQEPKP